MSAKDRVDGPEQAFLFDLADYPLTEIVTLAPLKRPIWTEHKAKLVALYLRYFVFITKHGNYIDGFAGPQEEGSEIAEEMWAAKLVMESEPKRLRKFWLCDLEPAQVRRLDALVKSQPQLKGRSCEVIPGDFNLSVDRILTKENIREKEATFCLLDQRAMECAWATVKKLALFKLGNKIELFYFLATGWLARTIAAFRENTSSVDSWWGDDTWRKVHELRRNDAWAEAIVERLKSELGYAYAHPWPIYERPRGEGQVKYHMIHASDHPDAYKLMWRAYHKVLAKPESDRQLELSIAKLTSR